jgi:hypothetical protein
MVTGLMSVDLYGYRQSGFEIARVETCRVYLATDSFWLEE